MDMNIVGQVSRRYTKYCLWIVTAIALVSLVIINVLDKRQVVDYVMISVIYSLVTCFLNGASWTYVAKSSSNSLGKFYIVASSLRLLLAIVVVLVFCILANNREKILSFIAVFSPFYFVMLVFESVFYSRVERRRKRKI